MGYPLLGHTVEPPNRAPPSLYTGNPGNATGQRFFCFTNGTINSEGGGVNYFPGTSAGSQSNGGQYV